MQGLDRFELRQSEPLKEPGALCNSYWGWSEEKAGQSLKGVVHPQNDFLSIDYSCLGHLSSIVFFCICRIPRTKKNGFSKFTPVHSDRERVVFGVN